MQIQTFESLRELEENVVSYKARIVRYMDEFKISASNNSEVLDGQDYSEFNSFVQSLMQEAKEKMNLFLSEKYKKKTERLSYEVYESNEKFRNLMSEVFRVEKFLQQNFPRVEKLLAKRIMDSERFVDLYHSHYNKKRAFILWRNFIAEQNYLMRQEEKAYFTNQSNTLRRFMKAWRCYSYKSGFRAKVKKESKIEIMKVESEYVGVLAGLEKKIKETEELIAIKRNAKNEFAYSLNRDILKTISNLSMEMMTLSQVSLKDNLPENSDNLIFMDNLRSMIDQKMKTMSKVTIKRTEREEKLI